MNKINCFVIFLILFANYAYLFAQQVSVVTFENLQTMIHKPNDTTYIVHFFASWCAPCVKELPAFVQFSEQSKMEKVKILLVSLDLKKDIKKQLVPLSIKLNLGQNVYLLDEPNANNWIPKIDINWGGDIPATLFRNAQKNYNQLFNQSFTTELLFQTLKSISNEK